MKPHKLQTTVTAAAFALLSAAAFARPLDFRELSLLVRAHESDSSIVSIASHRKLVHALTPQQDALLRGQGASESLLRSLHNSNVVLSESEAAALEASSTAAAPETAASRGGSMHARSRGKVEIIDVSVDEPINLSTWGGPDLELSVRPREIVESGRGEMELVDPALSHLHYATYHGIRVPDWEPVDPAYTSIAEHTYSRPLQVDWRNPITVNELPYLLYPAYSSRGIAVYFVARTSDETVRLAVMSR